jgi:hypothetical protein
MHRSVLGLASNVNAARMLLVHRTQLRNNFELMGKAPTSAQHALEVSNN